MKLLFNYLLFNKKLFKTILFGLLLFTIEKVIFVIRFGELSTFSMYSSDLTHMIFNSLRFDLQALGYILSFFLFLNHFTLLTKSERIVQFINSFSVKLIPVILTLALLVLMIDQQFYSFFKLHINSVAFDFFDEEPRLLLKSIWTEHPVIQILILLVLLFMTIRYCIKMIYQKTRLKINSLNLIGGILISFLFLGFYMLIMRGSVGTFPLQKEDTDVSENEFINACVPNALFSLKEAFQENKEEYNIPPPDQILRNFGYTSIKEPFAELKGVSVDSIQTDQIDELVFAIKKGSQQKKYNVVLLIMESMSNHFIYFHTKDCNLLGSFEKHVNRDIIFRNFQSSGNGTIVSLEDLLINSPFHSVFNSKYRFLSYETSVAKPFKDAGYKTSFITGIELGWRNLDESLKRQYFDLVYGKSHILNHFPEAKSNNTWGVFDHSMFDFIYNQLEKSDSSQFIVSLSSTNHTPYELPKDYEPYPIDPRITDLPLFTVPKERCLEVLTAFQYSNDALGRFMDQIKNSKLAENTIVIITGDHNIRSIISYNTPQSLKYKYSVPLYFYIPKDLKDNLHIDTARTGSHYDIMTSVYPYILKNVKYLNLGQDLFNEKKNTQEYYSMNDEQFLYGDSLSKEDVQKKQKARQAILFYYYSTQIYKKDRILPK